MVWMGGEKQNTAARAVNPQGRPRRAKRRDFSGIVLWGPWVTVAASIRSMARPALRFWLKPAIITAATVSVIALVVTHADLRERFEAVADYFRDAGPVPFFLAMALLPAGGFPLGVFTAMAGPVFGPVLGLPVVIGCALLAVTANAALSYWIAARALRPLVQRLLDRFGYRLPVVRPGTVWPLVVLTRIVPGPPFFLQSYLLGVARVPFGVYMLVSTLVPAAYLIATIVLADALVHHDTRAMIEAAAIFFVAGGILHQLRRRLQRPPAAVTTASAPDPAARSDSLGR